MIFIDTGALYALIDKNDTNHRAAKEFYTKHAHAGSFCLSIPIITETCMLLEIRLGSYYACKFWKTLLDGVFEIVPLQLEDLEKAFTIESKYRDSSLGFVDTTTMALIERHRIKNIFTFDRKHFNLFKPSFAGNLELLP